MRWSKAFIPTLRDDPADSDAPSHRLLVRAGFVRQLTAGHYSYLPMGMRVRQRVISIIREEINAIGGQEFLLPTMQPAELWKTSGRWDNFDVLFRFKDRKGQDTALGATHEEAFTDVSRELSSYKELPQLWYHFQTKFRDEARPKSGLLRVREFMMKDSYSFDIDEEGLDVQFQAHRDAYLRIFERLGIPAIPVVASSGNMGGKASVEFMSPTEYGEDIVVSCPSCGYAANLEKAESKLDSAPDVESLGNVEQFPTPGVRTIADLEKFDGGAAARDQIKTLVFMVDDEITLVLLRGDDELVEQKLIDFLGAGNIRPARAEEISAALGAMPGSLGAVGVTKYKVVADNALSGRRNMTTGANVDDVHIRNVDVERDIAVDHWASLRKVVAGETCLHCGEALQTAKAVEVGHIFKLGRHYTEPFDVNVLGPDGTMVKPVMGSYGIGIDRAVGAIIERSFDDKGLVWPASVAPFDVAIVPLNVDQEQVFGTAMDIYRELIGSGYEALLDDRDVRAGVKLNDVELVGIPLRVAIGKKGIERQVAEVTRRSDGETIEVPIADVVEWVRKEISATKL